jgi:hypothetical protein
MEFLASYSLPFNADHTANKALITTSNANCRHLIRHPSAV